MSPQEIDTLSTLFKVTPFSKYFAMVLFVALPFVGGLVGYTFAPEKIIEIEKVVTSDVESPKQEEVANIVPLVIDQGEYQVRYIPGTQQAEIIDAGTLKVVQIIPLDAFVVANMTKPEHFFLTARDINYDYYLDLGVLESIGSGGKSLFYTFYVYDPQARTLKKETIFDGESAGGQISNPSFDLVNKKIVSTMRNGLGWQYTEYVFDGTMYMKGKSWSEKDGE